MKTITIDLSFLVFVGHQDGGALFLDGDGDYVLFLASGNQFDRAEAVRQLGMAVNRPCDIRQKAADERR